MRARRERTFRLEFDPETLELVRLRPMDRRGKVLESPGELASGPGTLIRVIKARDEASLRRDYDFGSVALVSRAEREALNRRVDLVIDAFPEAPARRALQLCTSTTGPRLTLEEAAVEAGCEERDVRSALSPVYAELRKREDEELLPARLGRARARESFRASDAARRGACPPGREGVERLHGPG